ncbi:MAG: S26 family signal peptidase, partial [Hadesarchaea archaeon]|nr:S26 family signal peptidase [Hadesarchaea archaeon]
MDKKTISILVLLALVTFAGVGWIRVGMRSTNGTLPTGNENISPENLRKFFPGYENYLNREMFSSPVRGSSMEPTFGDGDKVLWVQVDPAELKVGDIIIYNHPTK